MTRTVNLNSEGVCGASFVGADELQIVTGCQDGRICIRDITDIGAEAKEVRRVDNHPIHCVAANPKRDQFAIGDKAGGVHVSLSVQIVDVFLYLHWGATRQFWKLLCFWKSSSRALAPFVLIELDILTISQDISSL